MRRAPEAQDIGRKYSNCFENWEACQQPIRRQDDMTILAINWAALKFSNTFQHAQERYEQRTWMLQLFNRTKLCGIGNHEGIKWSHLFTEIRILLKWSHCYKYDDNGNTSMVSITTLLKYNKQCSIGILISVSVLPSIYIYVLKIFKIIQNRCRNYATFFCL